MAGQPVRATKQRAAIRAVLEEEGLFRSAQELHDALRARGSKVGLTTVYRTLQALESAGEVDALRSDEGETLYRLCAAGDHHHHLVCRSCGRTEELDGGPIEDWVASAAKRHGFSSVTHTAEVFGLCRNCS